MHINQKELFIQVKFGLNQLVSMEPDISVPTIIIGHVAKHCKHVFSSPGENNNIEVVYNQTETYSQQKNTDILFILFYFYLFIYFYFYYFYLFSFIFFIFLFIYLFIYLFCTNQYREIQK